MDPAEVRRRNLVPQLHSSATRPASAPSTTSATTPRRSPRARRRGLRRPAGRAGCAAARRATRSRWASASRCYVEITAGAPGERVRRGRAARRRAAARAHRRDAVRPGPRHDVGDDRGRPHRRADRAHRGRPRRHRPSARPAASPSARGRCSSAARRSTPQRRSWSISPASGPPTCSRPRSTTSCSTSSAAAFHVAGTPARTVDWADVAASPRRAARRPRATSRPVMPTFPFGAHVAVVEVDTETGHVGSRRLVARRRRRHAHQPAARRGPGPRRHRPGRRPGAVGGRALRRRRHPQTTNFADYPVISAAELPSFELVHMETPTFANPLGRQGRRRVGHDRRDPGRATTRSSTRCRHLGVRHLEMPLTPERAVVGTQRICSHREPTDATLGYARTHNDHGGDRLVDSIVHQADEGRQRQPSRAQCARHRGVPPLLHRAARLRSVRRADAHDDDALLPRQRVAPPRLRPRAGRRPRLGGPAGALVDGASASRREPHRDRLSRPRGVAERSSST